MNLHEQKTEERADLKEASHSTNAGSQRLLKLETRAEGITRPRSRERAGLGRESFLSTGRKRAVLTTNEAWTTSLVG